MGIAAIGLAAILFNWFSVLLRTTSTSK